MTAFSPPAAGGTVLLCREQLIRQEIPVEPHDYPIPWVLTERGLYEDGIPAPWAEEFYLRFYSA